MPVGRRAGRSAGVVWVCAVFCALFAAMLVHGVGGAATHGGHHGSAAHHAAEEPTHGHTQGEDHLAAAWTGTEGHAHVDCLGTAAATFGLFIALFWAHPLGLRRLLFALPRAVRAPLERRTGRHPRPRDSRRLLAELSLLRV
ncbi:hypothetical protein CDO52_26735 [Nocardiopsis gilva YIM 90087]|uniref:Uncharacterized protein n=1 Tax=Nocardiopsis gilva YIM 90087 TaxID=1235441 RepID=A0A223SCP3_9ACTN|nr:hypothetical protein [Nocardiopsis gilva]ASU85917.1 hypothetical protein CDO52_26735 [Nocardiopsis gilva YIM 90087]